MSKNLQELVDSADLALAEYYCKKGEYEKGLELFKRVSYLLDKDTLTSFNNYSLTYAKELAQKDKWGEAIEVYKVMLNLPNPPAVTYKNMGLCMKVIDGYKAAVGFLEQYKELVPDDVSILEELGDVVFVGLNDSLTAIRYYEKALKNGRDNFHVNTMLGHIYSTYYRDSHKKEQMYYLERAYTLNPTDRTAIKNWAFVNGKFGNTKKADELYKKMLKNDPTHSDVHSYGAYLVRTKRFQEGFKYLRHRFEKEDLNKEMFSKLFYSDKMYQPGQDLKGKKVLVHYEQGFGDSILFIRFAKDLEKITGCKLVGVVVQPQLESLFKSSELDLPIYTVNNGGHLEFDCVIPMMDLPLAIGLTPETLKAERSYLKVEEADVKKYKDMYLKDTKKFKVGICYEGSRASAETKRDIPLSYFYPLMRMDNVEVYSFQVEDAEGQMDKVPEDCKLIRLGSTFKSWKDTACAIENMDLMISTDNGVMNLAGALGKKTFGLYNSIAEWRWFDLTGKDVKWYKTVKPYCCIKNESWEEPMKKVMRDLKECMTPVLV